MIKMLEVGIRFSFLSAILLTFGGLKLRKRPAGDSPLRMEELPTLHYSATPSLQLSRMLDTSKKAWARLTS